MLMLHWLLSAIIALAPPTVEECKQCIVLAEQSQHRVAIADVPAQKIIWEWKPELSNVKPEHVKWFSNPSDAKVVYKGAYILTCASGGGVALVRIADKKTVFYAYAGGNTHSAEVLPDGNIVAASSTGNYLTVFSVDTTSFPENVYSHKIPIPFGHNVVWDHQRKLLWSAGQAELHTFKYNFNKTQPDLIPDTMVALPGKEAHDLFPVYNSDALWLTNTTNVYQVNAATKALTMANTTYQKNIKSVSDGPESLPVIITLPKTSWWTDEVLDIKGQRIFFKEGLKIYKARWVVPNTFSYGTN